MTLIIKISRYSIADWFPLKHAVIFFGVLSSNLAIAQIIPKPADGTSIIRQIEAAKINKKLEYETTNAYFERQQNFLFKDGGKIDRELIFTIKAAERGGFSNFCSKTYNADEQELQVFCKLYRTPGYSEINLSWQSQSQGSYTAANSFNRKVIVEKKKTHSQSVNIYFETNENTLKNSNNLIEYSVSIPATPEQARKIREKIGIAFAVNLISPYLIEKEGQDSPTIDHPVELTYKEKTLEAKFRKLMVFNIVTGEVYRTFVYKDRSIIETENQD